MRAEPTETDKESQPRVRPESEESEAIYELRKKVLALHGSLDDKVQSLHLA